jgi:sodium-dependent phosphate cotransporter
MSVQGNIKPLRSLTEPLQIAKDNGAKRALIPRILETMASSMAQALEGAGGLQLFDPLKAITKPVSEGLIRNGLLNPLFDGATARAVAGLVVSAALLFGALYFIVWLMRSMVLDKVETVFTRYVGAHWLPAMGMGLVVTVRVQSSSITTTMLVPMAGAGILSLAHAFPITLGANVGTTITALLASLGAGGDPVHQQAAVTIAFVHLLFNLSGILIWYPIGALRRVPMRLAQFVAAASVKNRAFALVYVAVVFFALPGALIMLYRLLA